MRFAFMLLCTIIAVFASASERLYVVQYNDESLGRVDPESGDVNPHVLDLGYGCNDIAAHGNRLYVVNSLMNSIQEIDAESQTTLREISTTGGMNPYSLAMLNDDTILITNFVSNNLLLLRISDGQIVGNIPVGLSPEGIVVHENRVFVCLTRYSSAGFGVGCVMILNRATFDPVDSLCVGKNPQFAAIDDQNRLHVVCTGDYVSEAGSVYVFNLDALESPAILHVGGAPSAISFGGGYAFLSAGGWGGSGMVFRYRLSDLIVLNSEANPIYTATGATDVIALSDGSFFVSCAMSDIIEHRHPEGSLIHSYSVGAGPGAMLMYGSASNAPVIPISPPKVAIAEAYPNPFNGVVRLQLDSPSKENLNIIIYNSIGQEVDMLRVCPGESSILWNTHNNRLSQLSTGNYWAVWDAEGSGKPIRLTLIR